MVAMIFNLVIAGIAGGLVPLALERFGYMLLILAMFTGVFGVIFGVVMPIAIKLLLIGALR